VSVPDAFEQIAGDNLAQNCRIESLTAGVMKVRVTSGPYMFELRTRATQIIEGLRQQCPSSNIREIKLVCSK
jgi:predicted nucleic acid-binding Zn ribbon protein